MYLLIKFSPAILTQGVSSKAADSISNLLDSQKWKPASADELTICIKMHESEHNAALEMALTFDAVVEDHDYIDPWDVPSDCYFFITDEANKYDDL